MEIGNKVKIGRVIMDGIILSYIVIRGIEMLNGLIVDCLGKVCMLLGNIFFNFNNYFFLFIQFVVECCIILVSWLFWIDGFLNCIEFLDFNGENCYVLVFDSDVFINDIVI